jgi:hypothetical protein
MKVTAETITNAQIHMVHATTVTGLDVDNEPGSLREACWWALGVCSESDWKRGGAKARAICADAYNRLNGLA